MKTNLILYYDNYQLIENDNIMEKITDCQNINSLSHIYNQKQDLFNTNIPLKYIKAPIEDKDSAYDGMVEYYLKYPANLYVDVITKGNPNLINTYQLNQTYQMKYLKRQLLEWAWFKSYSENRQQEYLQNLIKFINEN